MSMLKNAYAQAASKNGEDGPMAMLNLYETPVLTAAQDPTLRFGVNAMLSLDYSLDLVCINRSKIYCL